jgi:hypothetical protein
MYVLHSAQRTVIAFNRQQLQLVVVVLIVCLLIHAGTRLLHVHQLCC